MIWLILGVFGLTLGSFVNALVWRIHMKYTAQPVNAKHSKKENYSIINGRSCCTHCKHILAPLDLIPVISWILLRGKCRYCGKKIDDNPLVELTVPVIFIFSYAFWPLTFQGVGLFEFIIWLIFCIGFVALSVLDLRWQWLPDKIVYPMAVLAFAQLIVVGLWQHQLLNSVRGGFLGVAVLAGVFYLIYTISNGRLIGGGDVKLGIVIGLIVGGPLNSLLVMFLASVGGSLISLPLVLVGRANRSTRIPFGPFLIIATIIAQLFGASILNWYKRLYF
jgi:leader peptidase (prepilin peptidase) / N-methyltransferase